VLRSRKSGRRIEFAPHVARTGVDVPGPRAWWRHQVYWDQNTRAASPAGFFFTLLIRGVPFACAYALLGGPRGLAVLGATLGVRLATAAANAALIGDGEGLAWLWLLPARDLVGLLIWAASFLQRRVYWKGRVFVLKRNRLLEVR
jgi:ceramide glucosyltransferase